MCLQCVRVLHEPHRFKSNICLNNNMASCVASTTNNINKLTAATNHSAVARPGNGSFRWHASLYNFARMRQHSTIGIQDDSQPIVYEDPQEESLLF